MPLFEALNVEEVDPMEEKEGVSLAEELTYVILDSKRPDWFVCFGSLQKPKHCSKLT